MNTKEKYFFDRAKSIEDTAKESIKFNRDVYDDLKSLDEDVTDLQAKAHEQNTDTRLQDGSGVDSVVVQSGGIVDLPKQSRCKVALSSPLTVSSGTYVKMPFEVVDEDIQNEYDATNHRFTATKDGNYQINIGFEYEATLSDGQLCGILIYKNGSSIKKCYYRANGTSYNDFNYSVDVTLAANDYIEIYTYQDSGSDETIYDSGQYTWLNIRKVS